MSNRVYYSNSLIAKCEATLKETLSVDIRLARKPAKTVPRFLSEFQIMDGSRFRRYGGENDEVERPWILANVSFTSNATEHAIWCGFQLQFQHLFSGQYVLESVSFLLLLWSTPPYPLLRAEWDYQSFDNKDSVHAQPHWHILVKTSLLAQDVERSEISEEFLREAVEFSPSGQPERIIDPTRIHLAMTASWRNHRDSLSKFNFDDDESMISWLKGVTSYSRSQVVYLFQKSRASPAMIQEFRE